MFNNLQFVIFSGIQPPPPKKNKTSTDNKKRYKSGLKFPPQRKIIF